MLTLSCCGKESNAMKSQLDGNKRGCTQEKPNILKSLFNFLL